MQIDYSAGVTGSGHGHVVATFKKRCAVLHGRIFNKKKIAAFKIVIADGDDFYHNIWLRQHRHLLLKVQKLQHIAASANFKIVSALPGAT